MSEDFNQRWQQLDWDDISLTINSKNPQTLNGAECHQAHPRRFDGTHFPCRTGLPGANGTEGPTTDTPTFWKYSQFLCAALSLQFVC